MGIRAAKVLAIACVCALMGARAEAGQATVGGVSISLPAPAGFCELERSNRSDKIILDLTGKTIGEKDLLAMSADCRQLADWRAHRRKYVDDFTSYAVARSHPAADQLKNVCAAMRTSGARLVASNEAKTKADLEAAFGKLKFNDSFMGFLGDGPNACYAAQLQKMERDGAPIGQIVITAVVAVKAKLLFAYHITPYVNAGTMQNAFVRHKATIAALLAANGG